MALPSHITYLANCQSKMLKSRNISREFFSQLNIIVILGLIVNVFQLLESQEYSIKSYQMTNQHRFQTAVAGGFWGHHLGHMVRTNTQGLWYVDDTGNNGSRNPAINYHHFDGMKWTLMKTLTNPSTIQQNTATIAVGDTIFSYGINILGGGYVEGNYIMGGINIEEAVYDTKTGNATYNRKIRFVPPPDTIPENYGGYNYIGAAVSPSGTRVVWWTMAVDKGGPSKWLYMFNTGGGWSNTIISNIPDNAFSYVFSSFVNDSVLYVGGELPGGYAPNWTYGVGAGKIVLGNPMSNFTKMKGLNIAVNDIWVNRSNGDVHLFPYGPYGTIGYFYKPANGVWTDTVSLIGNSTVGRWRFIDSPDGNLYLIMSQSGFKYMIIPKNNITGKINFTGLPIIPINNDDGFTASYAIWPEVKEFQTAPVGGINFAYPGNDYSYSNILRHVEMTPNNGSILININIPNGTEVFEAEIFQNISWYKFNNSGIDSVKIELSSDGGISWSVISTKTPNNGKYLWKVPQISSSKCLVRIVNPFSPTVYDVSDVPFTINTPSSTGKKNDELSQSWKILGNYPNPFNNQTIFRFHSGGSTHLTIDVFNVLGQSIAQLFDHEILSGDHSIPWNGKNFNKNDVPSGMYFVRFETPSNVSTIKTLLLR
jgi:hypothetical protein